MKQNFFQKLKAFFSKVNVQVTVFNCITVIAAVVVTTLIMSACVQNVIEEALDRQTAAANWYLNQQLTQINPISMLQENIEDSTKSDSVKSLVNSALVSTQTNLSFYRVSVVMRENSGDFIYFADSYRPGDVGRLNYGDSVSDEIAKAARQAIATSQNVVLNNYYKADGVSYAVCVRMLSSSSSVKPMVSCTYIDIGSYMNDMRVHMIVIGVFVVLIFIVVVNLSNIMFRRISNLSYVDAANMDKLTGLKNKNSYEIDVENIINSGKQHKYSCLIADLNGLKRVNDTLGHQTGDMYIRSGAEVLRNAASTFHYVAYRIGGDEFALLCKDATSADMEELCERIDQMIEHENHMDKPISMSKGYAMFNSSLDSDLRETLERADVAMYTNKHKFYADKEAARSASL